MSSSQQNSIASVAKTFCFKYVFKSLLKVGRLSNNFFFEYLLLENGSRKMLRKLKTAKNDERERKNINYAC